MKYTSNSVREHLDSEVTSLCTCWKITRQDGKILCFTDADSDLNIDGDFYLSIGAYSRSAIESTSELSVDNLDVTGMATDLVLPITELRAGAFDNAEVLVFMTSWLNPGIGMVKLRKGFFGEVRVLPNGTFDVELRGLLQKLAHNYTEIFSATCRNDLGDTRCGIDLIHPFSSSGAQLALPIRDSEFEELGGRGAGATAGWYDPTNSGELMVTTAPTNTGTYAARGGVDGYLQQDISLPQMGTDFIDHVEEGQVSFRLYGWRRDNGSRGRVSARFIDDQGRSVRRPAYISAPDTYLRLQEPVRFDGDLTFEFWMRTHEITAAGQVLLSGSLVVDELGVTHTYRFDIMNGYSNETRRKIYLRQQHLYFIYNHVVTHDLNATAHYDDGQWHHIALTRSGNQMIFYIDAMPVGSTTLDAEWHGKPYSVQFFGGHPSGTTIRADYDEIRLWDGARAQWEIAATRFRDLPSGTSGLRHYFPFENGTGDEGSMALGSISPGAGTVTIVNNYAPVTATYRGMAFDVTTNFVNVGTAWTMMTLTGTIPPNARYMRLVFDALPDGGAVQNSLLDSLFGYFMDADSTITVPNLEESGTHLKRAGMVVSGGGNRRFRAAITEPRAINGWFNGGLVTFYTGKNAGASMEVKNWLQATGEIELYLSLPYSIEPGDTFTVYPGCDKSRICCTVLFDNIENMFATPDVPGEDELFRYPDAT